MARTSNLSNVNKAAIRQMGLMPSTSYVEQPKKRSLRDISMPSIPGLSRLTLRGPSLAGKVSLSGIRSAAGWNRSCVYSLEKDIFLHMSSDQNNDDKGNAEVAGNLMQIIDKMMAAYPGQDKYIISLQRDLNIIMKGMGPHGGGGKRSRSFQIPSLPENVELIVYGNIDLIDGESVNIDLSQVSVSSESKVRSFDCRNVSIRLKRRVAFHAKGRIEVNNSVKSEKITKVSGGSDNDVIYKSA